MIQRQMTLKVYNVRKLHRPRLSDGFLADSVDTTLARWLGGVVVRAPDSRSEGRGFDSRPRHCRATTLGKLYTPMCLCSPSGISWYLARAFVSMPRMWQPMAWVQ